LQPVDRKAQHLCNIYDRTQIKILLSEHFEKITKKEVRGIWTKKLCYDVIWQVAASHSTDWRECYVPSLEYKQ